MDRFLKAAADLAEQKGTSFLGVAIEMLEKSENVEETGRRMKRMLDHAIHAEIESRKHQQNVSRKWLECALKNHHGRTINTGETIGEFIGKGFPAAD
jgi:hypothetical protein